MSSVSFAAQRLTGSFALHSKLTEKICPRVHKERLMHSSYGGDADDSAFRGGDQPAAFKK
jgi:hypothetical protein